jgi:hypothetical protein
MALGAKRVEPGDVLFLALEDTKLRLRKRIEAITRGQHMTAPPRLTLAREWPRQDKGGLALIQRWLHEHPAARLVVIDTWAKFRPGRVRGADSYEEDYAHASEVKAVADKRGVAVEALHHCRKGGAIDPVEEVSGTMGLTGAADAVHVLRRERGQHDAALFVAGRDVEEQELALSWDREHHLWSVMGDAESYRLSKERATVLEVFRKAGRPLTPSMAAPLLGKPLNSVKKLLWSMERDGQLQSLGEGHYIPTSNRSNYDHQGNRSNSSNRGNPGNRSNSVTDGDEAGNRSGNRPGYIETPWG